MRASVIPGLLDFLERHQVGGLDQAAKILFADVMAGAVAGGETHDGLVFHFQPLQVQDAKVFLAAFPDLILLQFYFLRHGWLNYSIEPRMDMDEHGLKQGKKHSIQIGKLTD